MCGRWLVAFLVLLPVAARADDAPVLGLDPGGHTARAWRVLFAAGGRQVLTVGDDKVIRLWDVATGETVRTLRGQVGPGPEGMLYAAALSPDGRTLAVGGYGTPSTSAHVGDLRLLELATGRIVRVLHGHAQPVPALAYPPEGSLLASGGRDATVRLWQVADGQPGPVLRGHKGFIYGVAWSPDGRRLASASLDGTARIWTADGREERVLRGHSQGVDCVAWAPDGRTLATGSLDQTIRLWDAGSGAPRASLPRQENQVTCLAYSPDGRWLASGLGGGDGDYAVRLWSLPDGRQVRTYRGHANTVMAVAFAPDSRLVASADFLGEVHLWDPATGAVKRRLRGAGAAAYAVAWSPDGARVAWGNRNGPYDDDGLGPLEHSFDLPAGSPAAEVADDESWLRTVTQEAGRELAVADDGLGVTVREGGRETVRWRQGDDYDQVRCVGFTPGGDIIAGSDNTLKLWTPAGRLKREFVGHTGVVWAVAVSPDGRYLASASGDQTVRVWPLTGDQPQVQPLLSLFSGADREWVAWTPEGYYACSPGAERWIGWQVNCGIDQAADYYPAYQFRRRFYRPDVITRLLEAGSTAQAVELADADRKTPTDPTVTAVAIRSFAPPAVTVLYPADGATVATPQLEVRARIQDPNQLPVGSVNLLLNGRNESARGLRPKLAGQDWAQTVALAPGENTIAVIAVNSQGAESVPQPIKVTYRPPQPDAARPNLYVLAAGVSRYQQADSNLKYAAKDATDFARCLVGQEGKAFGRVVTHLLTDEHATRGELLDALETLAREATSRDTVMVFIAGHGLSDTQGGYFLMPSDGDPERLARTAIRRSELQELLQAIPGRVLLALDTCHSGGIQGARGMRPALAYTDTLRELGATETGVITFASCQPTELALERDDWQNGAFAKALVEALSGQAANAEGQVTLVGLEAYVLERVKALTEGRQHPTLVRAPTIPGSTVLAGR